MNKNRKILTYLTGFLIGCGILLILPREELNQKRHPWHAQTAPEGTYPMEIEDELGRTVRFEKQPRHFISLAPSLTEILFAMDMGDHLMAVTQWCRYPSAADELRKAGAHVGRIDQPDIERITAYRPDLILATKLTSPEVFEVLHTNGRTVSLVLHQTGMDDILDDIKTIGIATGVPEKAHDLIKRMAEKRQNVEIFLAPFRNLPRKRVLFLLSLEDPDKPGWAPGGNTHLDSLIEAAHAINVTAQFGSEWGEVSLEALLKLDPEVILLQKPESKDNHENLEYLLEKLVDHPVWSRVDAVRSGRLHWIENEPISIPGPRVMEGYAMVAEAIWKPERNGAPR